MVELTPEEYHLLSDVDKDKFENLEARSLAFWISPVGALIKLWYAIVVLLGLGFIAAKGYTTKEMEQAAFNNIIEFATVSLEFILYLFVGLFVASIINYVMSNINQKKFLKEKGYLHKFKTLELMESKPVEVRRYKKMDELFNSFKNNDFEQGEVFILKDNSYLSITEKIDHKKVRRDGIIAGIFIFCSLIIIPFCFGILGNLTIQQILIKTSLLLAIFTLTIYLTIRSIKNKESKPDYKYKVFNRKVQPGIWKEVYTTGFNQTDKTTKKGDFGYKLSDKDFLVMKLEK